MLVSRRIVPKFFAINHLSLCHLGPELGLFRTETFSSMGVPPVSVGAEPVPARAGEGPATLAGASRPPRKLALFRTTGIGLERWNGGILGYPRRRLSGGRLALFRRTGPGKDPRPEVTGRGADVPSRIWPQSAIRNREIGFVSHAWPPGTPISRSAQQQEWVCLHNWPLRPAGWLSEIGFVLHHQPPFNRR